MHLFALLIGSLQGDQCALFSKQCSLSNATGRTEELQIEETSIEIIFNFSEGVSRRIPRLYGTAYAGLFIRGPTVSCIVLNGHCSYSHYSIYYPAVLNKVEEYCSL